jgi:hypothetical protein
MMRRTGALRRVGATEPEILHAASAMNRVGFDPPMSDPEVDAIARCAAKYEPAATQQADKAVVITIADVEEQEVRWLWQRYLPWTRSSRTDQWPNRDERRS